MLLNPETRNPLSSMLFSTSHQKKQLLWNIEPSHWAIEKAIFNRPTFWPSDLWPRRCLGKFRICCVEIESLNLEIVRHCRIGATPGWYLTLASSDVSHEMKDSVAMLIAPPGLTKDLSTISNIWLLVQMEKFRSYPKADQPSGGTPVRMMQLPESALARLPSWTKKASTIRG